MIPGHQDKLLEDLSEVLRSPTLPTSPAPAYSTLPYRDVDFHFAPLLNNRPGEIELETSDGKKFLVHQSVLEQETVFFHIYYGFVPVWRVNQAQVPPMLRHQASPAPESPVDTGSLTNLLCLPKIVASVLRASPSPAPSVPQEFCNPIPSAPAVAAPPSTHHQRTTPPSCEEAAPHRPPKDVLAPTPTTDPYTWAVPESAAVLEAFLSLIYPPGTFTSHPDALLTDLQLVGRVIRASMGYQSQKALLASRDRLSDWIPTHPVEVYSMACFFRFSDLAKLASAKAISVPRDSWSLDSRTLMGRSGAAKLLELQESRLVALRTILQRGMEEDEHSHTCPRRGMIQQVWSSRQRAVLANLKPDSELLELLAVDLRGGHCGECMVLLGTTIQKCLYAARELPREVS